MLRVSQADYATQDGRFQDGNFGERPATRITSQWLNSIQEEIAHVILSRGMTLDEKDESQLLKAILDLYQYGVKPQTFEIKNGMKIPTDLPLESFSSSQWKAVFFQALSIRHTTQADVTFFTTHVAVFNSVTARWDLLTQFDPAIIQFEAQKENPRAEAGVNPHHGLLNREIGESFPKYTYTPGPHLLSISASGKLQVQTSTLKGENHQGNLILSHFQYLKAS